MSLDQHWFTEVFGGSAFSLKTVKMLESIKSDYQQIDIYETESFGNLMVIDGCTMLTSRDNFLYHEMMSHPALFSHPNPNNVLIIGGGDCGTLLEVLKHPNVEQAVQVDIDEQVTRMAEKYFPELTASNNDPRAQLKFEDGVACIKNLEPGSIDVIIVDSTDPVGFAEGLFKQAFFEDVYRALSATGIIVQQSESPLLHIDTIIKDLHENMKGAGFKQVVTLPFPQPIYPSGWWSCTLGSKQVDLNQFRSDAAENKAFDTRYYTASAHQAALVPPPFCAHVLTQQG